MTSKNKIQREPLVSKPISEFPTPAAAVEFQNQIDKLQDKGIIISEKIIRRLMKEEGLAVSSVKQNKYNSYRGEISPEVENIIVRNFHSETPNTKWLTAAVATDGPAGWNEWIGLDCSALCQRRAAHRTMQPLRVSLAD